MNRNQLLALEIITKAAKVAEELKYTKIKLLQLENENKQLKAKLEDTSKKIENIKETNKIAKIAVGMSLSDLEKTELKNILTEKINQIDRCLNMLNNIG